MSMIPSVPVPFFHSFTHPTDRSFIYSSITPTKRPKHMSVHPTTPYLSVCPSNQSTIHPFVPSFIHSSMRRYTFRSQ